MPDTRIMASWGAIVTSVVTLMTFTLSLFVVFFFKDPGLLNLVIGAVVANATTVINFWLGSSSGSQKKDDALVKATETSPSMIIRP